MKRRKAAPFDLRSKRVREITMLVLWRHRGLPDTDDRDIYLEIAAHHLRPRDGNLAFALTNWGRRIGADLPRREVDRVVRNVTTKPRRYKAAMLGKMLRVTYEERRALKLTTIRCCDVSMAECVRRSKEMRRQKKTDRRRAAGAKSRAEYLANAKSRRKPWVIAGMSRRTWYRRQATKLAQVAQVRDHQSSSLTADTLVPTKTPRLPQTTLAVPSALSVLCPST
jgi:hypothetical protein